MTDLPTKNILITILTMLAGLLSAGSATAQEFPGLGVGDMWANELAFQNQFYNWAARGSWEVALNTPNDQPLPFNAMTISNSITEGSHAFEGYIHNSQVNSNRQLNAIENFSETAIRGNALYYDSSGYQQPVLLPYGPNSYTPVYDGFTPDQNVFVPSDTPSYDHGSFIPWGW